MKNQLKSAPRKWPFNFFPTVSYPLLIIKIRQIFKHVFKKMLHHGPPLHRAVLDGVEQVHGEADAECGRGDRGDVSPRPRHPEALVSQGIGRVVVVPELADRPVLVPRDLVLVRGHLLGLALLLLADLLLLVELLQCGQGVPGQRVQ